MDDVIAVILGGGAGTRLFPLTHMRSKPAVPLAGKYRLIDVPISNCINSHIDRIFVLTQFNSASLNRHIAQAYRFDRFRSGFVSMLAAEQTPISDKWFQGTADAVRQSLQHLRSYRHKYVLILSGDQLYNMDYVELLRHHRESGSEITVATIPVTASDAPSFGILKTTDDGIVTEFYEKPAADELDGKQSPVSSTLAAAGKTFLASMGIYMFESETLQSILADQPEAHDFGKQIIPSAIEKNRVSSFPFSGYWSDIGTMRSFYEANLMLADETPAYDIYNPSTPLYTNARMLPPAKVRTSTVSNSIIAEASIVVDSEITNSVIGLRSFLSANTVVRNSVIMGSNYFPWHGHYLRETVDGPDNPGIGEGTIIEGAIVDRNVSIGRNCVIRNERGVQEFNGDGYFIRDGLVVIPKNGVIPDGTVI